MPRCRTRVSDPFGLVPMLKQLTEECCTQVTDPFGLVPMVKQVE